MFHIFISALVSHQHMRFQGQMKLQIIKSWTQPAAAAFQKFFRTVRRRKPMRSIEIKNFYGDIIWFDILRLSMNVRLWIPTCVLSVPFAALLRDTGECTIYVVVLWSFAFCRSRRTLLRCVWCPFMCYRRWWTRNSPRNTTKHNGKKFQVMKKAKREKYLQMQFIIVGNNWNEKFFLRIWRYRTDKMHFDKRLSEWNYWHCWFGRQWEL